MVPSSEVLILDPCSVEVRGLRRGELVTVTVRCDYGPSSGGAPRVWEAGARLVATDSGAVSVAGTDPISGDWVGDRSGMGPWWSASLTTAEGRTEPSMGVDTEVTVRAGTGSLSRTWRRLRLAGGTKTVSAGSSRCRTCLYLPVGRPVSAGLVVVGGSGGGMPPDMGYSTLASLGCAVVTVAYFGMPGLPAALSEIPVEVALDAARELSAHKVPGRFGLLGLSRGSEMALLAAGEWPEVFGAVVAIAASGVVNGGYGPNGLTRTSAWTLNGEALPYARGGTPAVIEVEKIQGPMVTLVGAEDQMWDSKNLTAPALNRRRRAPDPGDSHLVFEGAGHQFFGYPGIPLPEPADSRIHPISGQAYRAGGTRRGNAIARDQSWAELLQVARHLAQQASTIARPWRHGDIGALAGRPGQKGPGEPGTPIWE